MKIATAAYPIEFMLGWGGYEDKLSSWVEEAAGEGADLLVFPEYAGLELASLGTDMVSGTLASLAGGALGAADMSEAETLEHSLKASSDRVAAADALHQRLAKQYGVHILAGSVPVFDAKASGNARPVNRARLFAPGGEIGIQDKQIMTRFERETWDVSSGGPLQIFDTTLGRIGVLICYDAEFPLLGRALAECDIILVPSCTDSLAGYWRVRIGAMARALEQQCVTVMASTVGDVEWSPAVDHNVGTGGVFGPPDLGFPETGVLAEGTLNTPGWTYAEVSLEQIAAVRSGGQVFNHQHWDEQTSRTSDVKTLRLR